MLCCDFGDCLQLFLASHVSASFTFYRTKHVILNREVGVALIRFSMRETGNGKLNGYSWTWNHVNLIHISWNIQSPLTGFFLSFCCLTHYWISTIWRFRSNLITSWSYARKLLLDGNWSVDIVNWMHCTELFPT